MPTKVCYICNPGHLVLIEDLHVCEPCKKEPKEITGKMVVSTYYNNLEVSNEKA